MLRVRCEWLARPWFFVAVAVLALNDHVFKAAWPGWVTGKLSDFAGLVVIATIASVLFGSRWGTVTAGLVFVALKTVPGVAELLAPALGGGVTLRDPSDLLALAVLPLVFRALASRHPDQSMRSRRGWQAVGLIAAVLATTATSPPPRSEVEGVGYVHGSFYAEVFLEDGYGTRWLRSADGGATWAAADDPGRLPEPISLGQGGLQVCAVDGVCYQARTLPPDDGKRFGQKVVERMTPGVGWQIEADLSQGSTPQDLAVDADNSARALVADMGGAHYRTPGGDWQPVDLIALASDPKWQRDLVNVLGSRGATLVLFLLVSILGWFLAPWTSMKWVLQVLNVLAGGFIFVVGILSSPLGLLQLHVKWVAIVAALTGLMRLTWWLDRRSRKKSV